MIYVNISLHMLKRSSHICGGSKPPPYSKRSKGFPLLLLLIWFSYTLLLTS